jgi:putative acetyltransferase
MEICVDDLSGPAITRLLQEHRQSMFLHSPPESVHALDLEAELDPQHGEIKSMRTAPAHLRRGVASRLVLHILEEARTRSYRRLSLETGSAAVFAPALRAFRIPALRAIRGLHRRSAQLLHDTRAGLEVDPWHRRSC